MADLPYTPNPVWWVQLRLLGGWTRLLSISAIYLALLIAAAVGFRYLARGISISAYCDAAIQILAFVQTLLIVIGGCNAVYRALSRDVTTNMLESHRLTPLSGASVVLGYLVGSNAQVLSLYAVGVVVGTVVIRWGTIGVASWIVGNIEMLFVAPMAWAATLVLGIGRRKPTSPGAFLFVMVILGTPLLFIPGAGLLSGIYAGYIAATTMTGTSGVPFAIGVIPLCVTAGMSVIWGRGAMRKFRRPDLPAFGPIRAAGLLVIWLAAASFGLMLVEEVEQRGITGLGGAGSPFGDESYVPGCLTATAIVAMLVALFPLYASALASVRAGRGVAPQRPGDRLAARGQPLFCVALIVVFLVPHLESARWDVIAGASAGAWASLLVVEAVLIVWCSHNRKSGRMIGIYIVLLWVAPPLLDVAYGEWVIAQSGAHRSLATPTMISGMSPFGGLARVFLEDVKFNMVPGVAFQVASGVAGWVLLRRALRRIRRNNAPETI